MSEQMVRLIFPRVDDPKVDYYEIHRQLGKGPEERIMRVEQSTGLHLVDVEEWIEVDGDRIQLSHYPIPEEAEVTLQTEEGDVLPEETYFLNKEEGWILFQVPVTKEKVHVQYAIDGYIVYDTEGVNDKDVSYYGPPAQDRRKPIPPRNLFMYPDGEKLRFYFKSEGFPPQEFTYSVVSMNNEGHRSIVKPKTEVSIGGGVLRYILERDIGNGVWMEVETGNELYDVSYDTRPPEGLSGFKTEVSEANEEGEIPVTLSWETPLKNERTGLSAKYRIRIQGLNGEVSDPSSTVGPDQVKSQLEKVVILRSATSAIPPVYGDETAIVVAEITDLSNGSYTDTVKADASHAYSLFVVDKGGNVSIARTAVITV